MKSPWPLERSALARRQPLRQPAGRQIHQSRQPSASWSTPPSWIWSPSRTRFLRQAGARPPPNHGAPRHARDAGRAWASNWSPCSRSRPPSSTFSPWFLVLLIVAVIPAFLGETRFAMLAYSMLYRWTPERRELDYLRMLGASSQSAKEVKIFGLGQYLADRSRSPIRSFLPREQGAGHQARCHRIAAEFIADRGLLRRLRIDPGPHDGRRL